MTRRHAALRRRRARRRCASASRVPDGVVDRLLADAQQLLLDVGGHAARLPVTVTSKRTARSPMALLAGLAQRGRQIARCKPRRAQIPDRLARLADVLLDVLAHPDELLPRAPTPTGSSVSAIASNCSATPTRLCSSVSWISRLKRHALAEQQRELPAHLPHAQPPRAASRPAPSPDIAAENQRVW